MPVMATLFAIGPLFGTGYAQSTACQMKSPLAEYARSRRFTGFAQSTAPCNGLTMHVFDHCKGVLLNNNSMSSYRDRNASPLHKEHHKVTEQLVMAVIMSRMVSEVLLLKLLMFRSTMSVLVNERYSGAQDQHQRDRWGSLRHL